jgi:hypothetical protein
MSKNTNEHYIYSKYADSTSDVYTSNGSIKKSSEMPEWLKMYGRRDCVYELRNSKGMPKSKWGIKISGTVMRADDRWGRLETPSYGKQDDNKKTSTKDQKKDMRKNKLSVNNTRDHEKF